MNERSTSWTVRRSSSVTALCTTGGRLTVREVVHELKLDPHDTSEGEILDDDVLSDDGWTDSDSYVEHDLGVDLFGGGGVSHVLHVVGSEADGPFHHHDI